MSSKFNKIYIEITNVCNLDCSFCPKTNRTPEFMSLDVFKKSALEAKPLCKEITLHIMGEPLLHPEFKEIIKFCEKENININLTTNASLIEKKYEILINTSIKKLNFSIHSLNVNYPIEEQKTHLKNIIEFTKFAQENRDDLIIIYRLWNINNKPNKNTLNIIEKEFDIILKEENKKTGVEIYPNTYINYDTSFQWPDSNNEIQNTQGYCHGLSTHIGILSNGIVVPCCLDNNGTLALGNIKENTLKEILNFPRAVNMKKGFQERRLVEDMCKTCSFIKRLKKNKIKLKN